MTDNADTERILIRGVNWIGDAVLTIPAIKAVRHACPGAHIGLLVKPWVADIFKKNSDIDEIILYEKKHESLRGKFLLAKELRRKKFDKAILLQNAFDAALITWLAGIPEKTGYKRDGRGFLLTTAIPVSNETLKKHQVYYYLDLLKVVGINAVETQPYIRLTDEERDEARNIINKSIIAHNRSPLIGINPGAAYGSAKRWAPESFAEVINNIIKELDGRVIIFGGPSEVEIADEIIKILGIQNSEFRIQDTTNLSRVTDHASRLLNMAGRTDIRRLASLISECDAFITNDSGPMHMASALFVPTVALFGSTDSTTTGPYGKGHKIVTRDISCAPCLERECPEGHLKCMMEITGNDVLSALKEVLPNERAVFLDKDGTLIEDKNYLNSFDDLVILADAGESLKQLEEAGFKLIGITNQSGIARGFVDEKFVRESNEYLKKELGINDFYYCPHHPDEGCDCRKPEPLMLLKAKTKHRVDMKASYMIGDKESDVLTAKKTGATGILISQNTSENTRASYTAKDLNDACEWILKKR